MSEKRLANVSRVLVFRPGYLGDTVVALPAFRLIARKFPGAELRVLTQFVDNPKAAPLAQVLERTGLAHGYIRYPPRLRGVASLSSVRSDIRKYNPDVLVYLAPPLSGSAKILRDVAFFRWCGVPVIIGVPYARDLRIPRQLENGLYEYEGLRLLRCLKSLGEARIDSQDDFDLNLSESDHCAARAALVSVPSDAPMLAISIGAKIDVKDWGEGNWAQLIRLLNRRLPNFALVTLGAEIEGDRSQRMLELWSGPKANLCGRLSVRESAAVMKRARLFLGHDSGPMHLAAAAGTACVSIFSSRQLPGIWYPWGKNHRVLFKRISCEGCNLDVCVELKKACIASIGVDEVANAVLSALNLASEEIAKKMGQPAVAKDGRDQ